MSCNWIVSQAAGQIFRFSRILTEPTPCWETSPLELLLLFNSGEWTRTHCSPIWHFCRIEGTTRQCLKTVLLCFSTAATAQGGFGVAVFTLQPQICAGRWHFPEKMKKSWKVTWPKRISWHLPENVSGRAFSRHTLQSLARKHFFKNMLDAQKSDCFFLNINVCYVVNSFLAYKLGFFSSPLSASHLWRFFPQGERIQVCVDIQKKASKMHIFHIFLKNIGPQSSCFGLPPPRGNIQIPPVLAHYLPPPLLPPFIQLQFGQVTDMNYFWENGIHIFF